MNPLLIGFHSPAPGCGKTTAARWLSVAHGFRVQSFATPLKEMLIPLLKALGYSEAEIDYFLFSPEGKEEKLRYLNKSPREMLQTLGTEWGRELVHSDLWLQAFSGQYRKSRYPVVVDDVRFMNEIEHIKSLGGYLVKLRRDGVQSGNSHASNTEFDDKLFDYVVYNDGTVEDLQRRLNVVVDNIKKWYKFSESIHEIPMPAQMY